MKKEEILRALKESAENVKKAEDTVANIETKVVEDSKPAEGMPNSELPTQKEIEKEVAKDEGPIIPVDKDGVSKDGGECDCINNGSIEAERKKEDNGMKDVINVSSRKVEESDEVNAELLRQLQEAADREESYKEYAADVKTLFESVIKEGEKLEAELTENAKKNEKMFHIAKKLYESSNKLNKILLEAVKNGRPEKKMTRYCSPAYRISRM